MRALEAPLARTFYALQYRLCEAGQQRHDPRLVRRTLEEIADNHRPRRGQLPRGPDQPHPGVFALPGAAGAAAATSRELAGLVAFSDLPWVDVVHNLADRVMELLGGEPVELHEETRYTRELAGHIGVPSGSRTMILRPDGQDLVGLLVSHDLEWIYADNHLLWQFLVACRMHGARPHVLARKISPTTFSVLKAVGAIGLQYYAILAPDEFAPSATTSALELALPYVRPLSAMPDHPVILKLRGSVLEATRAGIGETQRYLIDLGASKGLASAETANPTALREWADEGGLQLPPIWHQTIEQWEAYGRYRRRGALRLSTGGTVALAAPTVDRSPAEPRIVPDSRSEEPSHPPGFGRKTTRTRVPLPDPWRRR
jgi:hypothetical protein